MIKLNQYVLRFSGNGNTSGNVPITQSVETEDDTYSFTIPNDNNLLKTGYIFAGWSENNNATTSTYRPGDTIVLTKNNSSITLYAVWLSTTLTDWNALQYMQQINSNACAGGDETGKQLIDARDGKKYWVAKLKDGNCWMTQNLDYDDPNSNRVTSTSGTNGGPASGDWKGSSSNNNAREYWDPGEKVVSGSQLINTASSTDRHLLVGNYYSWASATNGTGSSITTQNDNASDSICPEGWSLPLSGTKNNNNTIGNNAASGSFGKMLSYYGVTASGDANLIKSPLYFLRGGVVYSGILNYTGSNGFYWSSTGNGASHAYFLTFNSSGVNPSYDANATSYGRYNGMFIRCVAR